MAVRISEKELVVPALQVAADQPNGEISTRELIVALTEWFEPEGEDAEILDGRVTLNSLKRSEISSLIEQVRTRCFRLAMPSIRVMGSQLRRQVDSSSAPCQVMNSGPCSPG